MLAEPRPDILDDRYEIGALIGRGGMGDVHRAIDHRLGREVAVKFLRADLAVQPTVRTRFEDEARSAARLTHPNVVLVLDSGEHDRVPYLVMECLSGHTLYDELVRGPVPPERARSIASDMLAALAAAHELGIVHRDVKPANILLTDDGRAKLADFGIAKSAEGLDHTLVGQVLGTPAYLAPERLAGKPATPSRGPVRARRRVVRSTIGRTAVPGRHAGRSRARSSRPPSPRRSRSAVPTSMWASAPPSTGRW